MGKVGLSIGRKNERSCGTCTKCCEGWLVADIKGITMEPGKPCHLVEIGKGCSDYKNRPETPCKTFSCMWKAEKALPEQFSPEKTGVIITVQSVAGIDYLAAAYAGQEIQTDFLSWFVAYCVSGKLNFEWVVNGQAIYIGSDEFTAAMNNKYGIVLKK